MPSSQNRREFFRTIASAGAAGLAFGTTAAWAAESPMSATRITDNVSVVTTAGGNVVVLEQPDGVLIVNGTTSAQAQELLKFLTAEFKGKRIAAAFNTDWHLDHTGSNEALRKAGAKIIAHENTKLWLGNDFYSDWQKTRYKPQPADALPNETFYTNGKMTFGTKRVEYGYMMQAHTDGDIYVFFPDENVLVPGDVMTVGRYPILDYVTGGWIGGLQNACQALLKVANEQTRIVPGAGPVQTHADLQAQSDMCNAMRDRLVKLMRQGMGPQDMIAAAPSKDFDPKWGSPDLFIQQAYRGMWGHVRELGNIV